MSTPASTVETAQGTAQVTQTPAQAQAKMMTLKINGKEMQLPESEVIALAQKSQSADARFQEASKMKQEAQGFIKWAKEHPKEAFQQLGVDVRKFSEDTLMEIINQQKMSPEQRELAELKKYKAQQEKQAQMQKQQAEQAHIQALTQKQTQDYDTKFSEALKLSGITDPGALRIAVARMAQHEMGNIKKGLNVTPTQLAEFVRGGFESENRGFLSGLDGDALLAFIGRDGLKKIAKAQLAKIKGKETRVAAPTAVERKDDEKKPTKMDAWKAMTRKTRSML
jgi:hypothetical protein